MEPVAKTSQAKSSKPTKRDLESMRKGADDADMEAESEPRKIVKPKRKLKD